MKQFILFSLLTGSLMLAAFIWNEDDPNAETSIQFTDARLDDLLAKAKKENKVIFVDIYATWCGPCKLLKKTTFTDKEVGEYFNTNFINAAYDGEKEEGSRPDQRALRRGQEALQRTHQGCGQVGSEQGNPGSPVPPPSPAVCGAGSR